MLLDPKMHFVEQILNVCIDGKVVSDVNIY